MYKTSVPIAIQSISDTETEKDTSLIDSLRAYFYSALTAVFAMVFFLITSGGECNFNGAVLIYSAFFAVFYIMAMVGTVRAVDYGELSVTTLIN